MKKLSQTQLEKSISGFAAVFDTPCDQCLFSKGKIVTDERKEEILQDCQRKDSFFICHKSKGVCCSGFYERFSTGFLQVAGRLGKLSFINTLSYQRGEIHHEADRSQDADQRPERRTISDYGHFNQGTRSSSSPSIKRRLNTKHLGESNLPESQES